MHNHLGYAVAAVLTAVLLRTGAVAAEQDPPRIVTHGWVAESIADKNLRVIDTRDNVADYWEGHIPGAVYLDPDTFQLARGGVPALLLPEEQIIVMLGRLGIDESSMIVLYGERSDDTAAFIAWALDYVGHERYAVLDGGFQAWKAAGRPLTQEYPRISERRYPAEPQGQTPRRRTRVLAALADVRTAMENDSAVLLDVRPEEYYTGKRGPWKRPGHIPGALQRYWQNDINADGTWKSRDELKEIYAAIGVTPDRTVIVYGTQGQLSAFTYFTLKYLLGFPDVRNYDGGFSEWTSFEGLPVEKGTRPLGFDAAE